MEAEKSPTHPPIYFRFSEIELECTWVWNQSSDLSIPKDGPLNAQTLKRGSSSGVAKRDIAVGLKAASENADNPAGLKVTTLVESSFP